MSNPAISAQRTACLFIGLLILGGCASGPKIITNRAPDFNIADYRTYSYLQPLSSDRGDVRSLISTHLITATDRELQNAGLRRVEKDGDLLINFVVSTRETLSSRSTPTTGMSMHHGVGRYGTWSGYSVSMSTTEVIQQTEGTIAVDVINRARNQLVWEGAATGRVTDSVRQNMEEVVHNAIADVFLQFP